MCPCGAACRCNPCRCGNGRTAHESTHDSGHASGSGRSRNGGHKHGHGKSHRHGSSHHHGHSHGHGYSNDYEQSYDFDGGDTTFRGQGYILGHVNDGHHTGRDLDPRRAHPVIWTPIPQSYLDSQAQSGTQAHSGTRNPILINNDDDRVGQIPGHNIGQYLLDQLELWQRSALTSDNGLPQTQNHYILPDPHMRELFGDDYTDRTPDEYMVLLEQSVNNFFPDPQAPIGADGRTN
ncbi:hypothetical protein F4813DRAFT_28426 [Daldinia decipiens]|uniref:uncharacterized protein n=1 Tax=Daldinia decipiens TaxID=326647 RepID=UPI0020C3CB4A|nr:uncharacterized protein F4813DRAFT_28426 [Daldinia decipiens]KAI1659316.1 hypothetical protein F4813DRAFT_28426 [Daldinia decipiens]